MPNNSIKNKTPENVLEFIKRCGSDEITEAYYHSLGEALRKEVNAHPHLLVYFKASEKHKLPHLKPYILEEIAECLQCMQWYQTEPEIFWQLKHESKLVKELEKVAFEIKRRSEESSIVIPFEYVNLLEELREKSVEEIHFSPDLKEVSYTYAAAAATSERTSMELKLTIGNEKYRLIFLPGLEKIKVVKS